MSAPQEVVDHVNWAYSEDGPWTVLKIHWYPKNIWSKSGAWAETEAARSYDEQIRKCHCKNFWVYIEFKEKK